MPYLTTDQHAEIKRAFAQLGEAPDDPEEVERLMLDYVLGVLPREAARHAENARLLIALTEASAHLMSVLYEALDVDHPVDLQAWLDDLMAKKNPEWAAGTIERLRVILRDCQSRG